MKPFHHEELLWNKNIHRIACCDEVGRGCLFGPVVAAAVILKPYEHLDGVKDSKKLSPSKRTSLYLVIKEKALAVGIGVVAAEEIDRINIKQASRKAMKLAVEDLRDKEGKLIVPEALLIDAEVLDLPYPQRSLIHGEDQVHGIAAASIVAKVIRDQMCESWHEQYPVYGLNQHKGYATKNHREALLKYGPSPLHRLTFIRKLMNGKG
ncbi:ribonuclease HII [Anoxynatronum sibiricum]|uniref:Ribonuclease HII n=1 Tax=Anoxynatronum sibiricum TaxID=210623 RepID=A0ABU9VQL3_9CLOT